MGGSRGTWICYRCFRCSGPAHGDAIIPALRDRGGGTFDPSERTIYPAWYRPRDADLLAGAWDRAERRRRRAAAGPGWSA